MFRVTTDRGTASQKQPETTRRRARNAENCHSRLGATAESGNCQTCHGQHQQPKRMRGKNASAVCDA